MRHRLIQTAVSFALASMPVVATAAGTVEVNFIEPARFSDTGFGQAETERTVEALRRHLQAYAARLRDGHTLRVEVLDVDRAGNETRPGSNRRVLLGGADAPSIQLRYTLQAEGRTLTSGEERLTDLDYLGSRATKQVSGDYGYELRLLDEWFAERIATP